MSNWHDACDLLKGDGWRERTTPLPPGMRKMDLDELKETALAGSPTWRREFAKKRSPKVRRRTSSQPPKQVTTKTKPEGTAAKLKRLSPYRPIPKPKGTAEAIRTKRRDLP